MAGDIIGYPGGGIPSSHIAQRTGPYGAVSSVTRAIAGMIDRINAANDNADVNYPGSYLHKLSGNFKYQFFAGKLKNEINPIIHEKLIEFNAK